MQHVTRLILPLLFAITLGGANRSQAAPAAGPAPTDYKRADNNYYWKGDVLKVDPTAVILTTGSYTQKGDVYTFTPKHKAPKELYIQVVNDWIEPITPPDMPASLGVPPEAMQIREPRGDVQVAFPSAPATFLPVTEGMTITNGSIVKTGANGTAAVLFGGVDSARLIPNSEAAVQQTVTALLRTTEIDLTKGAVFSKVGKRPGEKQDYQVHTPFGVAAARGTDFVSIAMPTRTDVWIAEGTVQMDSPDGKLVGSVSSEGNDSLKIIRFPKMPNPHDAMMASAETMTTAMNVIPTINVKVKVLEDKLAQGGTLTANETAYLARLKQVPCLIKLDLVEAAVVAPVGVPPLPPAPIVPAVPLNPIDLDVRVDGKVDFQGATLSLEELKAKLADLGKATPDQPIVVRPAEKAEHKAVKRILAYCATAKLSKVTVDNSIAEKAATDKAAADKAAADKAAADKAAAAKAAADKAAADKAAAEKAAADKAAAVKAAADKAAADKAAAAAAKVAANKAAADKAAAEAKLPPTPIEVRADGKVDFQGATLSLDELKPKLDALAQATPNAPVVVKKKEKLIKGQLHKVTELCHAAQLKNVTVDKTEPKPAPAPVIPPAPLPVSPSTNAAPTAPMPPPAPAKQLPPTMQLPLNLEIRPDGKVDFESATLSLNELKVKLEEIAKTTPGQPLVVHSTEKVPRRQVKKVVALCHAANLTDVILVRTARQGGLAANSDVSLRPLPPTNSPSSPSTVASSQTTATNPSPADQLPSPTGHNAASSAPVAEGPNDTVP